MTPVAGADWVHGMDGESYGSDEMVVDLRQAVNGTYLSLGGRGVRQGRARNWRWVLAGSAAVLASAGLVAHHWRAARSGGLRGATPGSTLVKDEEEDRDFCGDYVQDIEFHTRASIYWVGNILNEAICCAECDAHPECLAWTYGKQQGIDGLSNDCYLKKLEEGEEPQRVKRTGVVSGLLMHKLQKHGIVAGMLASKLQVSKSRQAEQSIAANDTCAGPLNLTGYGRVQVVRAAWRTPGVHAGLVEVPYSNWAVIPHLGGRAYFASSCTPGKYNFAQYTSLKLLGGKIRYTADVSQVGCGCNAQFHLVPMCQNMDKSACVDYSCGHGSTNQCGSVCSEIVLQDANQYAWSSSIHVHLDNHGLGGGYGGGAEDSIGHRNWTSSQYGPGGECIDTTWPFEVEVSFPVDKSGNLASMDVMLTQEDHACPLKLSLRNYRHDGKDAMLELTEVLRRGVTPSIAYDNHGDLQWLDGAGSDAQGPCVKEVPEACPPTMRFYDFVVETGMAAQADDTSWRKAESPMEVAMATLHTEVAQENLKERLEEAIGEGLGDVKPCTQSNCRIGGTYADKDKLEQSADHSSYVETEGGNIEWEVLVDDCSVWSNNASESHVLRELGKGNVVTGKKVGVWIKLSHEPGYVLAERGGRALLKERVVTYAKIVEGACRDSGMFAIREKSVCQSAAFALGYFDTSLKVYDGDEPRPEGCHLLRGELWLAIGSSNVGNGVMNGGQPLCADQVYPTTTITTTTTRTTTTMTITTITTTSTTTWGWPSIFCLEVVRSHGYELPLVKEQQKRRASIFSCDEYSVFSDGGTSQVVGIGPDGLEIKTIVIPAIREAIGDLGQAGTTTNSWLNTKTFLQVWDLAKTDGRILKHDWVAKVDPDAVFFPARLRARMAPHTSENAKLYLMNCNRFGAALYGSLEVFSKLALHTYLQGSSRCRNSLPWHGWGEDYFMSHCMDMLGVGRIYDFEMLSDKRCVFRPCWDKSRVSFHDYKDANPNGAWFQCWNASGGPWNPAG